MIFFTDLDGTVIRSASKKRAGDIVVEYKDGCEITCISSDCAGILSELSDLVIPVTSRSIEQYKRINIPGFTPKYALVSNGGNLLINGIPDKNWSFWSDGIAFNHSAELNVCRNFLENDPNRNFEIRLVDGLFLFTKSNNPGRTLESLIHCLGNLHGASAMNLSISGTKIYAIPKEINKGAAVESLANMLGRRGEKIVCAGDSDMDNPMLKIADIAVYPDDLKTDVSGYSYDRENFCEFTVNTFKKLNLNNFNGKEL